MPNFSKDRIEELKAMIRRLMVARDTISSNQVGEALHIDPKTANKLMNKIRRENTENIRNNILEKEIGKMEMHFKMLVQIHWETINNKERERFEYFDKKPVKDEKGNYVPFKVEYGSFIVPLQAKVQSAKAIVEAFEKLFNIKFDAGIFSRKLGDLDLKLPIAELVGKICELTGKNEFEWQKNKNLKNYKPDVEQKPADTITEGKGSGENGGDSSEVKE